MGDTLVVSLSKAAVKRSKVRVESELYTLFDFCLLADAVAQVIKLGSANLALADGSDRDDRGRMYGENLLTAYAVGDTANSDSLVDAAMLLGNDGAFERLCTLAVAFLYTHEDTHSVTDVHLGKLRLHVAFAENFDQIHYLILLSFRRSYRRASASAADRLSKSPAYLHKLWYDNTFSLSAQVFFVINAPKNRISPLPCSAICICASARQVSPFL